MAVLNFLINEIFGVAPVFLAIIAIVGLALQKKSFTEVMMGAFKTAIGVLILQQGASILVDSIVPLSDSISALSPQASAIPGMDTGVYMETFSFEIGCAMMFGFLLNLVVARFTRWKTVFLTGHMLYWFPFTFVAVGVSAGFRGLPLIIISSVTTAIYYVVAPNLVRPYIKDVIGDDSFTLGHPSTVFVLVGGFFAGLFGDKAKSTEDIDMPKNLRFLKEVSITGSLIIMLTYVVLTVIFAVTGQDFISIYGLDSSAGLFKFILLNGLMFGTGLTILLLGVRMMIAEIVPAFTGIQEKLIPNAIPAYDCPLLFPYAPNAVIIGFLVSMASSVLMIILCTSLHIFKYTVVPLVIVCFFECGTAAVVGNARGGRRGAVIAAAISGVLVVLLTSLSLPFFENSIAGYMIGEGNDFSLWSIIQGLILKLIPQ